MKYPDIIGPYYASSPESLEILLDHSQSLFQKSLDIVEKKNLNINRNFIKEACFLHDIGMIRTNAPAIFCYGEAPYLAHGNLGAQMLLGTKYEKYANICKRHLGVGLTKQEAIEKKLGEEELIPISVEEKLISFVDNFFSKTKLGIEKSWDEVYEFIKKFQRDDDDKLARFKEWSELFL